MIFWRLKKPSTFKSLWAASLIAFATVHGADWDGQFVQLNRTGTSVSGLVSGGGVLLGLAKGPIRSLDTGKTWSLFTIDSTKKPPFRVAGDLQFDPTSQLFYGIMDSSIYVASPTAKHWTRLASFTFLMEMSMSGKKIIANGTQLRVSNDGGVSWKLIPEFNHVGISGVLAADSCFYVSNGFDPLRKSCDGGVTWDFVGGGEITKNLFKPQKHKDAIFGMVGEKAIQSRDQGKSWAPISLPLLNSRILIEIEEDGDYLFAWRLDTSKVPELHQVDCSVNGGATWMTCLRPPSQLMRGDGLNRIAHLGINLFGQSDTGLIVSRDSGKTWGAQPIGGISAHLLKMAVHDGNMIVLTEQGPFTSVDDGQTWHTPLPLSSYPNWWVFGGTGPAYGIVNHDKEIFLTEDAGATWSQTIRISDTSQILSLAIWNGDLYVGTVENLWKSSLTARTWNPVGLPVTGAVWRLAPGNKTLAIQIGSQIWEMTGDGSLNDQTAKIDTAFTSDLWMFGENLFALTQKWVTNPSTNQTETVHKLFRFHRETATWTQLSIRVGDGLRMAGSGNRILNSYGAYSEDGGLTWKFLPWNSLSGITMTSLDFGNGHFYAGEGDGGIWKSTVDFLETVSISQQNRPQYPGNRTMIKYPWNQSFRPDGRAIPMR